MSLYALVERWRAKSAQLRCLAKQALNEGRERWGDAAIEYAKAREVCADELEAALAGGGEAVAWLVLYGDRVVGYVTHESKPYATLAEGETLVPVFTHPAGAAQVTDEMVEDAWVALFKSQCDGHASRINMRAALTAALNPGGSRE